MIKKEKQFKQLNEENNINYGTQPEFTFNVNKLVEQIVTNSAGIVRSSLDFEHQRQKMINKDCKIRFKESKKLDVLKLEYVDKNEIPEFEEIVDDPAFK